MNQVLQFVTALVLSTVILATSDPATAEHHESILITGASTGIGRHLAETLATKGYNVYAGARKDKDLEELDAIDNITAVRLDVTRQDQVNDAVELIKEKGNGPVWPGQQRRRWRR